MSPKKRYPLETLVRLRDEKVDKRARALTESKRRARHAVRQYEQAVKATLDHARATREQTASESERFDTGLASPEDMMRLHAWRLVQQQRAAELQRQQQAAADQQKQAQREATEAQQRLASARADAKTIEQHRQRHADEQRKAEERRLEDEVDDRVNARIRRKE